MAAAKITPLKCKIKNVEPDPIHAGRTIVSLEVDDGKGPWIQGFSLTTPDHPITVEELIVLLQDKKLERPTDPFTYIKEAQEQATLFEVVPTDPAE